jgi:hypothetical protein
MSQRPQPVRKHRREPAGRHRRIVEVQRGAGTSHKALFVKCVASVGAVAALSGGVSAASSGPSSETNAGRSTDNHRLLAKPAGSRPAGPRTQVLAASRSANRAGGAMGGVGVVAGQVQGAVGGADGGALNMASTAPSVGPATGTPPDGVPPLRVVTATLVRAATPAKAAPKAAAAVKTVAAAKVVAVAPAAPVKTTTTSGTTKTGTTKTGTTKSGGSTSTSGSGSSGSSGSGSSGSGSGGSGSGGTAGDPPPPIVLSGDQPGPGNTGVPAGTVLTVHEGDLTITTAGATYSGLDIHGYVRVEAPNVTIKDSIIRGGSSTPGAGIVSDTSNSATNFLLEDSEISPAFPTVGLDSMKGWNYTALRVNMHGTVDGAKFYGANVTVEDSWIHGLITYAHDPAQNGGQSHNDGVQVLSGSNMRITGNTIEGGSNTAIMVTQDHGTVSDLTVDGNWLSGGACTINMTPKPLSSMGAMTINNNIFVNNSTKNCPILDTLSTHLSASGNVYSSGGPVPVNNKGAG